MGFGLGPDSWLDVPGKSLAGVHGAVDFIAELKAKALDLKGVKHTVVIGGGNTAIDAVRELLGLKKALLGSLETVTMIYRGTEAGMSGYSHEWAHAKEEGARVSWQTQPIGFDEGAKGRVGAVKCTALEANKKPVAGSEFSVPADLVLLAVGQAKLSDLVKDLSGVVVEGGKVVAAADGSTGRRGVWAGGDCRNGGKEVVNAVAEGRDAAISIDAFLVKGGRRG